MGSFYGIILRNDYGITLRNHFYKKDPGDAQDVRGAPWDPGDPMGTPLGPPGDAPETPGHAPGTSWDAPGPPWHAPETPKERPWDPLEPPMTPYGSQKRSDLDKYTAPETLNCCVRTCSLGPIA